MKIVYELFLIAIVLVFIIDLSGFMSSLKRAISKYLIGIPRDDYDLKPFGCSLCMTWWVCLIYLLWSKNMALGYIGVSAAIALLAEEVGQGIILIKSFIGYTIGFLHEKIARKISAYR